MTKKKRPPPGVDEILERPWCYYCERDFDDLKVLTSHQKAKHFKCHLCNRRLNTAGGLSVHLSQVHKETLTQVDNALDHRRDVGSGHPEIFGMEGIPQEVMDAHRQRVITAFFQMEQERKAKTGNSAPNVYAQGEPASKRPKIESAEELKKRLAEHKAKREMQKEREKLGLPIDPPTPVNADGYGAPSTTASRGSSLRLRASLKTNFHVQTSVATVADMIPALTTPYIKQEGSPPAQGFNPFGPPQSTFGPASQAPFSSGPYPTHTFSLPPNFTPAGQGLPMPPRPYMQGVSYGQSPVYPSPLIGPPMGYYQPARTTGPTMGYGIPPPPANQSMGYGNPPSAASDRHKYLDQSYDRRARPYDHDRRESSPPPPPPSTTPPMSASGGLPQPSLGLPPRPVVQAPNLSKDEMATLHHHASWQTVNNRAAWLKASAELIKPSSRYEEMSLGDSVDDLINSVTGQGSYAKEPGQKIPDWNPPPAEERHWDPVHGGIRRKSSTTDSASASIKQEPQTADNAPVVIKQEPETTETAPPVIKQEPPTTASFQETPDFASLLETKRREKEQRIKEQESLTTLVAPPATVASDEQATDGKKHKKKHRPELIKWVYTDRVNSPEENMARMARYAFNRVEHTETVLGDISGAVTGATSDTVKDPQD